jgi:hypothetical protein
MKNPFGPEQVPGSYFDLQRRMLKKVQDANVNDHILEILQMAYEEALISENVVLSRPERQRLFSQISKTILQHMLNKLDGPSTGMKRA